MKSQSIPTLRMAKLQDMPAIIELSQNSIRNTCNRDYSPSQIEVWCKSVANPHKWMAAIKYQHFIIAEMGDKPLGFASIKNGEYLVYLYVSPSHQRMGIARMLLENLKIESKRLGKDYIWSNVSKTARPFFEKRGFMVEYERVNFLDDVEIRNYRMGLFV